MEGCTIKEVDQSTPPEEWSKYPWANHGSADSLDVDRVYFFPFMPTFRQCQLFCSKKEDNRNIYVVQDGMVASTFKGLPDECNNSILHTYLLHDQSHPLPIKRKVLRIAPLKATRAIRGILTRLTKTKYRAKVKAALRSSNFITRVNCLASIDFAADVDYENTIEDAKAIAFQMGQTIALIHGIEIYTKGGIAETYPELKPFMQRDPQIPSMFAVLNATRDTLVGLLKDVHVEERGTLNLFTSWPTNQIQSTTTKKVQQEKEPEKEQAQQSSSTEDVQSSDFTGLVVDMKTERVVLFPPPFDMEDIGEGDIFASSFIYEGQLCFATRSGFTLTVQSDDDKCSTADKIKKPEQHRKQASAVPHAYVRVKGTEASSFNHDGCYYPLWLLRIATEVTEEHNKTGGREAQASQQYEVVQLVGLRHKLSGDVVPVSGRSLEGA